MEKHNEMNIQELEQVSGGDIFEKISDVLDGSTGVARVRRPNPNGLRIPRIRHVRTPDGGLKIVKQGPSKASLIEADPDLF